MTVWAKLQSWIGAAASGTDLDNEFNNIYTGLNESQNGSRPSGYNDVRLTYSTDQLTVKGETKVNGVNVDLNSTITVSGATGWRYVVTTTGGVVSVETIPGGEITADTLVYTPTPVFNDTLNGYYSTVNTTRRIIGIIWYNTSTKILEAISYGNGAIKNDSLWETNDSGVLATAAGTRFQFTGTWDKQRGDLITCVDNGAAVSYDDDEGFRITFNKDCNADIGLVLTISNSSVNMHKKGTLYKTNILSVPGIDVATFTTIPIVAAKGDYFTFVNNMNSLGATISCMTIRAKEHTN
jgi:hypothetical protein